MNPKPKMREDDTIVCAACVAEGRAQPLEFNLACNWYVCLVHGPQVTGEFLWHSARPTQN